MARRKFIAGNWKLNLAPADARRVAAEIRLSLMNRGDVDVALFPTALSIPAVLEVLEGSGIGVGIQEVHTAPSGAFTGANSAVMARTVGCAYGLIGHSERRQFFGETDAGVNAKIKACLAAGLLPVVCIGETLAQREAGQVDAVIEGQLRGALEGLPQDQVAVLTLAYEPVWAIGTGKTASPQQAQDVHASIRAWLAAHYDRFVPDEVRIQYGGSVTADNAEALMACPDIDGALVGGASLKAEPFARIVAAAG